MIGIVSLRCQLLKTVGLLSVRLDLAKLQLKNRKRSSIFFRNSESYFYYLKITVLPNLWNRCVNWASPNDNIFSQKNPQSFFFTSKSIYLNEWVGGIHLIIDNGALNSKCHMLCLFASWFRFHSIRFDVMWFTFLGVWFALVWFGFCLLSRQCASS